MHDRTDAADLWAEVAEAREPGTRPPRMCTGEHAHEHG